MKRSLEEGTHGTWRWDIDKPAHSAPTIKEEFFIEGTRMYKTVDGRDFIADVYDKLFFVKKGVVQKTTKFIPGRCFDK